jgi:hypothetical protein
MRFQFAFPVEMVVKPLPKQVRSLRQHMGLTAQSALDLLQDTIVV